MPGTSRGVVDRHQWPAKMRFELAGILTHIKVEAHLRSLFDSQSAAMEYAAMTLQYWVASAVLGAAVLAPLSPLAAADADKKASQNDDGGMSQDVPGAAEFQRYCALCHGADGRGMGPLTDADAMKKSAADLTQIAQRNNGAFPFDKVAGAIRQGGSIAGHTQSRMMGWEKLFAAESDPARATVIVNEITRYIETLQVK